MAIGASTLMSNLVFQIPANLTREGDVRRHLGTIRQLWLVDSENRVELVWVPLVLQDATVPIARGVTYVVTFWCPAVPGSGTTMPGRVGQSLCAIRLVNPD